MNHAPSLKPHTSSIATFLVLTLWLSGLTGFPPLANANATLDKSIGRTPEVRTEQRITPRTVDEATKERVRDDYLKLPLMFERNKGQTNKGVEFLSRGQGYTLFLTRDEAVIGLRHDESRSNTVRMKLRGANRQSKGSGEDEVATKTNYFIGNDKSKWHAATNYSRVRYAQVYPGIDMIYHGKQRELEYDFEVSPGADPQAIGLEFKGVNKLKVNEQGELVLKVKGGGEIRQHKPVTFQVIDGERREVESRYVLKGRNRAGFKIGEYDRSERLVIDPVLGYSTYLGGDNNDSNLGIAVDNAGNAYVTGNTFSITFPTFNQYQTDPVDNRLDAFVAKFNTNSSGAASLLYSTYLGGGKDDAGFGIAADSAGNAYVTGYTESFNFPTLNQYQSDPADFNIDAFVTKLDTNLTGVASLVYSTYLGGSGDDRGLGIAVDNAGNAYITGQTDSTDFPALNQYQNDQAGIDAYVTKLNTNLSGNASLLYSTYLGGGSGDYGFGIAVDNAGNAYVTGQTDSTNFPTLNEYQTNQATTDAFVTKLDTNASGNASLLYSTYLGGGNIENGNGIAADNAGNAYVVGTTFSTNFPTLNQYQTDQLGLDVFVTKLDTNLTGASSLLYSTYLGGGQNDDGKGIAIDRAGNVYVTGNTQSINFPTLNPYQTNAQIDNTGVEDVFITKLNPNLTGNASLLFSTYLGGLNPDFGKGIAVDGAGNVYVAGDTGSTNFPIKNQYQTNADTDNSSNPDVFVTKMRFRPATADFDTDGKTDVSLWNPSNKNWYFIDSTTNQLRVYNNWGSQDLGDIAVPRDYDGDLKIDIAIWRPSEGNFYIIRSTTNSPTIINWGGVSGDIPVPADYDGDGKADAAVFRPSEGNWYIKNSSNGTVTLRSWGTSTDKLVPADYDGDGKTDIAVWRPSDGNWYIINSLNSTITVISFGAGSLNDQPVQADYDGDGKTDIAIWRPSEGNWYIVNSSTNTVTTKNWGAESVGDVPVPGDYDGDGKADIAVWRQSEGNWYILQSQSNTVGLANLGSSGDVLAPRTYLPQ